MILLPRLNDWLIIDSKKTKPVKSAHQEAIEKRNTSASCATSQYVTNVKEYYAQTVLKNGCQSKQTFQSCNKSISSHVL